MFFRSCGTRHNRKNFLFARSNAGAEQAAAMSGMKSFKYIYDCGDHWEHRIKVGECHPPDPILSASALCLNGTNAAPPEEVGGAPGYTDVQEAIPAPGLPPASGDAGVVRRRLRARALGFVCGQ
ncbi:MAG: hypothetical protein J0L85_21170 [Zoogloea sp.]|nr:hypothetical protein [Zoogloea sp.]MCA0186893.1 plasmid pRiA4b ORF-3 family protein [Pseudomonadota bacterium]